METIEKTISNRDNITNIAIIKKETKTITGGNNLNSTIPIIWTDENDDRPQTRKDGCQKYGGKGEDKN